MTWGWHLLGVLGLTLLVVLAYGRAIGRSLDSSDSLVLNADEITASVDVIIPAFNEAANIADCLNAVLESIQGLSAQVSIVDDQSTDETFAIDQI